MDKDRTNIDLVKERTDIVSVVGRYVKLSQAGKNFKGLCPFHNEKTPSFNVSPDLNIYKCFGCGKSGDVINFVEEVEKIDFSQALEKLAKEAGISLEKSDTPKSPVIQINNWAKIYFQQELLKPENKYQLDYLTQRGIGKKEIKDFEIGYAPGNGQFLSRLRKFKDFSKSILLDSGLFIEKNGALKEKFYKRIMFPLHNLTGKVIAFSGRKLPNNELGPKYLNSPETSIYQKRNNLYGLYQSKASIKKEDLCILVEAQTGVIALAKYGLNNAVAPLGTGLTDQQLELVKRYTNNILFIFDNDSAGQGALERAFMMSLKIGLNTYAINTGIHKDIDDLIQKNPETLKDLIENRMDTFTYLLTHKIDTLDISELKSIKKIEVYIKSFIQAVSDETTKQYYIQKAQSVIPAIDLEIKTTPSRYVKGETFVNSKRIDIEDLYIKSMLEHIQSPAFIENYENILKKEINIKIIDAIANNKFETVGDLQNSFKDDNDIHEHINWLVLLDKQVDRPEILRQRILISYYEKEVRNLRILLATAEEKEDTQKINELLDKVVKITDKLKNLKNENIKL